MEYPSHQHNLLAISNHGKVHSGASLVWTKTDEAVLRIYLQESRHWRKRKLAVTGEIYDLNSNTTK